MFFRLTNVFLPVTFPFLPVTFPFLPPTFPFLPPTFPFLPPTFPFLPPTFPFLPVTLSFFYVTLSFLHVTFPFSRLAVMFFLLIPATNALYKVIIIARIVNLWLGLAFNYHSYCCDYDIKREIGGITSNVQGDLYYLIIFLLRKLQLSGPKRIYLVKNAFSYPKRTFIIEKRNFPVRNGPI